jgi:hypothetical protein
MIRRSPPQAERRLVRGSEFGVQGTGDESRKIKEKTAFGGTPKVSHLQ